ncbi:MAG: hypothetical protein V1790_04725 [Planctomycetota bacterium]
MGAKLRLPGKVPPEDVRAVLEKCGFEITSRRIASIEICDVLSDLLYLLQLVQSWGDLFRANGLDTGICVEDKELIGVSAHAASHGQHALVLPFRTPEEALNLPRAECGALHRYGSDREFRADRLSDDDDLQIVNENLDQYGPILLGLLRIAIGSDPVSDIGDCACS